MTTENGLLNSENDLSGAGQSAFSTLSAQGYGFTMNASGQVTGMDMEFGTHTFTIPLPKDATFTVDGTSHTVTETITGMKATDVIQFSAESGNAGLYQVSQETLTITNPTTSSNGITDGYTFTIANNQVTGVQDVVGANNHTHTYNIPIAPDTVFAVNGNTVTETSVQGNAVETRQFSLASGSSLYALSSVTTTEIQPGTATTSLSVNPLDRAEFTINSSGVVTQAESVLPNGSTTTINPGSHTTFTQLSAGFVEEAVTSGSHSSYALFYEGSGSNGIYTEIAHGSGTTVDLVGIQSQIAQVAHASPALAAAI